MLKFLRRKPKTKPPKPDTNTESAESIESAEITETAESIKPADPKNVIESAESVESTEIKETTEFTQKATKQPIPTSPTSQPEKKRGWFTRLKEGLSRTRQQLSNKLSQLFSRHQAIDDNLLEELETLLLTADVGVDTTDALLDQFKAEVKVQGIREPAACTPVLKSIMQNMLTPYAKPIELTPDKPFVLLVMGVNGVGKTTSIAKIAHYYKSRGLRIMLAAGDTFRAAAVEQLQAWGERNDVPVIAQPNGADSASVIYDAMQSASAKQIDLLIADTAGRLHTQDHLMAELAKIKRVIKKFNPNAPHETLLVLDATMGQNALTQAQIFQERVGVSGITLTKLDGTARGGIIFSITHQLKLPLRFIGVGEQLEDLKPFLADEFVDALFTTQD